MSVMTDKQAEELVQDMIDSVGVPFVEERIEEYQTIPALGEDVAASREVFVEVATRMLEERKNGN